MAQLILRPPPAIDHGDHVCGLFDSAAERQWAMEEFVVAGLAAGDRVMCSCERNEQESFVERLDIAGANASSAVRTGQLVLRPAAQIYVPQGYFDPELTARMLIRAIDKAVEDGYCGYRATGGLVESIRDAISVSQLQEYEQLLEATYSTMPAAGLCQYMTFPVSLDPLYLAKEAHSMFVSKPAWDDGTLSVTPLADRIGIRLDGEVDEMNGSHLRDVVEELAKSCGSTLAEIHLELAGLRFVDCASASLLANLAQARGNLRLVLHDPPESLRRVVGLFWPESYSFELCPS